VVGRRRTAGEHRHRSGGALVAVADLGGSGVVGERECGGVITSERVKSPNFHGLQTKNAYLP
jgi:hypothetical protein